MTKMKEWEARCRRCGRCCFEKVEYRGEVFYTDTPCQHLDPKSRTCRVYPRRHELRPGCAPITPEVLRRGILPADCPYVADIVDYVAPASWPDEESS